MNQVLPFLLTAGATPCCPGCLLCAWYAAENSCGRVPAGLLQRQQSEGVQNVQDL